MCHAANHRGEQGGATAVLVGPSPEEEGHDNWRNLYKDTESKVDHGGLWLNLRREHGLP